MATRSTIAIRNTNGTVTAVYAHWDGYLSHNGAILQEHYNTEEKIRELIGYGDISSLGAEIGEQHSFDPEDPLKANWCMFYGRDCGDEDCAASEYASWESMLVTMGQEYNYIWEPANQCWFVKYGGRIGRLAEELDVIKDDCA